MFRTIVFLVKVGILVAAAVWVSGQKGSVEIDWAPYKIIFPHIGYFVIAAVATVFLGILIYRALHAIAYLPRRLRQRREQTNKKKGFRALTRGLTAVAAGDKKAAVNESRRASKLLPEESGLPLLLKAQSERLEGKEREAQETFAALTQDKDAGFLGVRGLLLASLEARSYGKALEFARQALKLHPRQPWLLKLVYDLEIKQRHWLEAQKILDRAAGAGALPAAQAQSDRTAILLARAEEDRNQGLRRQALQHLRQAYKNNPAFTPAALALAKFYKQDNARRKAATVIEKTWQDNPHPDLAKMWDSLLPPSKTVKSGARYAWAEKLAAFNLKHPESHLFAGRIAMEESLWGEAREHFRAAENIEPSARLYWLWANLEKRASSGSALVHALQEKASSFPPEHCWACRETGRIYEQWFPVAEPHGSFNTIEWMQPQGFNRLLTGETSAPDLVLEAPRSYAGF